MRAGFGFYTNAGRNNTVENNIFVDTTNPVTFGCPPHLWNDVVYGYITGNRILRNIIYNTGPSSHWPFWIVNMPRIEGVVGESDYNVFFKADGDYGTLPQLQKWWGYDSHSALGDPMFVDPEHDDYRLKPGSPALKLGFQPIDVEKIGLRD